MRPAFEDLLARFHADYVDLDMIHYVDKVEEYEQVVLGDSPFMRYVRELRAAGIIHHIGLSTHNTEVTRRVTENPEIEMVLFSVNPAFDMMPATDNLGDLFGDYAGVGEGGINADRAELYASVSDAHASDCIACRAREGRCPFGVKVADKMAVAAELFGLYREVQRVRVGEGLSERAVVARAR